MRLLHAGTILLPCMVLVCACETSGIAADTPAVLAASTNECHLQIEQTLGGMLGGAVSLSPDAFTQSSSLILERRQLRDAVGRPLDGRRLDRPDVFTLGLAQGKCVVTHQRTSQRSPLPACSCREQEKR